MKIFLNISVPDCYELVYIKQDSKTMTVQTEESTTTSKPDETEKYHTFIDIFLIVFPSANTHNAGKAKCNIFRILNPMV